MKERETFKHFVVTSTNFILWKNNTFLNTKTSLTLKRWNSYLSEQNVYNSIKTLTSFIILVIQVKKNPQLIKTLTHYRGIWKHFSIPSTLYKNLWKHIVCYFSLSYTCYFKCFKLVFLLIFLGSILYSVPSQSITTFIMFIW